MSEFLLTWLNEELCLSRKVTNFSSDFSNGFLFGEIFSRYGKQPDFVQFLDGTQERHKFANLNRLTGSFRAANIPYNPFIASCIMKGDKEVIMGLLSKMRLYLGQAPPRTVRLPSLRKSDNSTEASPVRSFVNREILKRFETEMKEKNTEKIYKSSSHASLGMNSRNITPIKVRALDLSKSHAQSNGSLRGSPQKSPYKLNTKKLHNSVAKKEDWEKELREWRKSMERKRMAELIEKVSEGKIYVARRDKATKLREKERNEVYSSLDAFDRRLGRDTREDFFGLEKPALKEEHPELFYNQIRMPELIKKSHDKSLYCIS